MSIDMSQFYQVFFEESAEHLASMESLLLGLDLDAPDPDQLNAIFRSAHSIKGGSGTFGFTDMTDSGNFINENSALNNIPFYVEIHSRGLVYSTIVLFIALVLFLITFFINRCRLTKAYGIFLIFTWLSVMTIICLFELNVFGAVHPEPCRK